jgi:NAD(P)-dependent dehydrogenase (short-subunit alcohol dehydrogenase family)
MNIEGSVALVTGANRGLGAAFVDQLIKQGAAKIYAGARTPDTLLPAQERYGDKLRPIRLDVTNPQQIEAVAAQCSDVTLLISNAGITCTKEILAEPSIDAFREVMEVNYFGPMQLMRSFAPTLSQNGGGGIVQVLSMAAMMCVPLAPAYSASKAAAEMLTHAVRAETEAHGTQVAMCYPGFFESDMGADFTVPKPQASVIAARTLDGFTSGKTVIFPDTYSRLVYEYVQNHPAHVYERPEAAVAATVQAFTKHPHAGQ